MVRAGRGGKYIEEFEKGYVAIGWKALGNLNQYKSKQHLKEKYIEVWGNEKPAKTANALAMVEKFRDAMQVDDFAISYNSKTREYLFGKISGSYRYEEGIVSDYPQLRPVNWVGKVSRDRLTQKARNSLSATLSLFSVRQDIVGEFQAILESKSLD